MGDTTKTYLIGHAPDDEVRDVWVTLDAEPSAVDSAGRLTLRLYSEDVRLERSTIAEQVLTTWQRNEVIRFERILASPRFAATLFLDVIGFQDPSASEGIWANVKNVGVTLLFSRSLAREPNDPAGIYWEERND